jgi:hypothetical protein
MKAITKSNPINALHIRRIWPPSVSIRLPVRGADLHNGLAHGLGMGTLQATCVKPRRRTAIHSPLPARNVRVSAAHADSGFSTRLVDDGADQIDGGTK